MSVSDSIDISVIIINYNTYALTCACIESVIRETKGVSYEIIIVDNQSSEIAPAVFKDRFPQIVVLYSPENLGFARGNNFGIQHSRGNCILLLNSDTELKNDAVSIAFRQLVSRPKVGVVGAMLQNPDGSYQQSARTFPSIKRELISVFKLYRLLPNIQLKLEYGLLIPSAGFTCNVDYINGAFFMFRKEDLQHFPDSKLHEDFFMYAEDIQWCDFFHRVLHKRVLYVADARVLHYGAKSSGDEANTIYNKKTGPNIVKWMQKARGNFYTRCYLVIRHLRFNLFQ